LATPRHARQRANPRISPSSLPNARLTGRDAGVIARARDLDDDRRECERDCDDVRLIDVLRELNSWRHPLLPMRPQPGDVLVSHQLATTGDVVSVLPTPPRFCGTHDEAIAKARDLAEPLRVEVWLTGDRTHFTHVASCRPGGGVAPGACWRLDAWSAGVECAKWNGLATDAKEMIPKRQTLSRAGKDLQGCTIRRRETRLMFAEVTRVEHHNGRHRRATVSQRRA
jgi:hypothetical protein